MSVSSVRLSGFGSKTNSNKNTAIALTISANTQNVNLFTLAGSPAGVVTVTCTVNSGVYCYASNTSSYGFRTGAFAAGSTITITNNGFITGQGSDGGQGAGFSNISNSGPGGGPAFLAEVNCTINGSGQINGGGGGGGGGGAGGYNADAGGGGGGRSFLTSLGGPSGTGSSGATAGGNGTVTGPGSGGAGFTVGGKEGSVAGYGGSGGGWGVAGASGGSGAPQTIFPSAGSSGGNAINRNGKTVSTSGITINGAVVG